MRRITVTENISLDGVMQAPASPDEDTRGEFPYGGWAVPGSDEALAAGARALGWRSLVVCLPFALIMAVDTLGWRYAFAYDRVPFLRLIAARMAGEALNVITGVAPVGGDAVKVWLNDRLLLAHLVEREAAPGQERVPISLRPGPNSLLAKVVQGQSEWGFAFRLSGSVAGLKHGTVEESVHTER